MTQGKTLSNTEKTQRHEVKYAKTHEEGLNKTKQEITIKSHNKIMTDIGRKLILHNKY